MKIATGFGKHPEQGLPSRNSVVLVFRKTGEMQAILQDEGYLTDIRTAVGAVAAKYLAPPQFRCIGIIGAGTQARLQLEYLREITNCRQVVPWARSAERARAFHVDEFDIEIASTVAELAAQARLIVTTTSSRQWLLGAAGVKLDTHITAVGADGGVKQELDPRLFALAKVRAVDSRSQCSQFGDSSFALESSVIRLGYMVELGQIIQDKESQRRNEQDIAIADLTGVAVQDIAVAELALARLQAS